MENSVLDLGRRTSTQRIAGFILGLEQRLRERGLASEGTFEFPLRYRHIADILGLTPVHVNRIISSLREQGVIELEHRTLSVRRLADLTAIAR
jgi:CRP-like cAMP-binding protein